MKKILNINETPHKLDNPYFKSHGPVEKGNYI